MVDSITRGHYLSPIHHLHEELLRHIFLLRLYSGRPFVTIGLENLPHVPLYLASICRSWRQLAFNTPELWSTCQLSYFRPELNALWLARAGERMLDLDGSGPFPPLATYRQTPKLDHGCNLIRFFGPMLPYLERCQSLSLRHGILAPALFPDSDSDEITSSMRGIKLPNLLSLELVQDGGQFYGTSLEWLESFFTADTAPKLQRLHIGWYLGPISLKSISNLTDLNIKGPCTDVTSDILKKARDLRVLTINDLYDDGPENIDGHPTFHGNLEELELDANDGNGIFRRLDSLTLPSLETLFLRSYCWMNERIPSALSELIHRSQCEIRKFGIENMSISILREILDSNSIAALATLVITQISDWEELMVLLSDTSKLPYLRELELRILDDEADISPPSLLEMLTSRRKYVNRGNNKLQCLRIFQSRARWHEWVCKYEDAFYQIKAMAAESEAEDFPLVLEFADNEYLPVFES